MQDEIVIKISPNYTAAKLENNPTIDDYIDVFEDRILGWYLEHAKSLSKLEHTDFAILMIVTAYFETIAMYMRGEDRKRNGLEFFRDGFLSVFSPFTLELHKSIQEDLIQLLYFNLRCGLYHTSQIRERIGFLDHKNVFCIKANEANKIVMVWINTIKFTEAIENHFRIYIKQLRDPQETELREKFIRMFTSK